MNKDNARDYLPLVQALAEGRVIQGNCGGEWKDDDYPSFSSPPSYYRIKPEPREIWLNHHKDGSVDRYVYLSESAAAEGDSRVDWAPVRYREVLE